MYSTLRWQKCKHNTGLTHTAHYACSGVNTIQTSHAQHTALAVVKIYMHTIQDYVTYMSYYTGSSGDTIQA